MKKLFLLLFLSLDMTVQSCNLCFGYTGRRLRKHALQKVECYCNCQAQGISKHEDGHKCVKCKHFVMPHAVTNSEIHEEVSKQTGEHINAWRQNKLKRYYEADDNKSGKKILLASIKD